MTRKGKRFAVIGTMLGVVGLAVGLVLTALSDSVAFFSSPTDLLSENAVPGQRVRLGGIVESGSIQRGMGETVRFSVTDTVSTVEVLYVGLLPDLFREGQGVVTEGTLSADRTFAADTVLAKHDENYMPREVVDDLKARGLWQHDVGLVQADAEAGPEGVVR